jgi:hypothetical protein
LELIVATLPERQGGDPFTTSDGADDEWAGADIQRLRTAFERVEGGRDIFGSPDFGDADFDAECASRRLDVANRQHVLGCETGHECQVAQIGDDFAQQPNSFAGRFARLNSDAGDIAARSRETSDQAGAERLPGKRSDDRDDGCRALGLKSIGS